MGLPVITTGHSAHVDFCTRDTATLVDFQFAPSRSHLRASDACWLEPDQASLTRALKQVCQSIRSTDPRLEHQRQAAVSHIRDTYRWHNSAQSLLASANWLVQDAKQNSDAGTLTHIALVSPWGTPAVLLNTVAACFQPCSAARTYRLMCTATTEHKIRPKE